MTEEEVDDIEMKFKAFEEEGDTAGLTDWEYSFMQSQVDRYEQYGARARFSDKQMTVIDRIYDEKLAPR